MTTWLSPHFTLEELTDSQTAARAGLDNTPGPEAMKWLRRTAQLLEEVRQRLGGWPIIVSSGYRAPEVNRLVGGAAGSQHQFGQAVDFTAPRFGPPSLIAHTIADSEIDFDQVILEFGRWVHLSTAARPRRQALVIDRAGTRPLQGAR